MDQRSQSERQYSIVKQKKITTDDKIWKIQKRLCLKENYDNRCDNSKEKSYFLNSQLVSK